MMLSFGVAAMWILKTKGNSLKQTIDPKPEQNFQHSKDKKS